MRIRDIIHRDGARLRLSLSSGDGGHGPLIRLADPAGSFQGTVMLDLYGAELLAAFLMSARLSAVGDLSDECCNGDYPFGVRLSEVAGDVSLEVDQPDARLQLAPVLWDRLYTELQLALAHGRYLREAMPAIGLAPHEARRLLH